MKKIRLKKKQKNNLTILLLLLSVLALIFAAYQGKEEAKQPEETFLQDQTTLDFIRTIGPTAQEIAAANDLYASVMIAQAVLESDSGQSTLSQAPNFNFFGIKGDYLGQSVSMPTLEDDGKGNMYQIDADFRSYGSQRESLQDYAQLLQKDIYRNVRRSYAHSYQEATTALTGTYATDTAYGEKLNHIIEAYGLTIYDRF
ncbi:N-acetylmuramoyl-L-alanine amidase [Streptococcus chenjunshii]|uniref:N-acetylmuramoyl-L-alanine amidase n=1 Tax=Streptococcus chenjunshii TaxID=2173853 RepID=A0A372KN68_9STRE|nr:glucosaminidase domain-containing protein [Streptococcus chenjunshii]AXQ78851.1 N-acetylmuramoyl-L-alanine amidase [Streptococcus chenjunshii]RFU51612.1 N-acetylmuramoyl-L-alanine amidase [Streptococcus chenjunshii]RFU53732.1 N-acetylmuramoyl-L-alanine amidase [Streptococcus chenjunshii]